MTDKIGKKRIGRVIAVILLAMTLVVGLIPNQALAVTYADRDTSTKYTESLGDNVSTEYAGRIWTDKSVYDEDATFETFGGGETTIKINEDGTDQEDFLIAYSALATSESVEGQTQAPVDVVLILDISGSMSNKDSNMDNGKSRIYNTVQAANSAIDELMALNPYTRVAVAAFSSNSQVLLPLDRYEKETRTERVWVSTGRWSGYWENRETVVPYLSVSRESGSESYATLDVNAINADGDKISLNNVDVQGGTNIQMGLYEGMKILVDEDSTTADINGQEVQRVPSIILLSDGSPTYSSNSSAWWTPNDNYNDGPGSAPYAGNGMKAILVGSYMKDAIDRNYEVEGTALTTTVYTVGMGITDLDDNEKNLAYMTLDPGTYWNDAGVTNSMKTTIKGYWNTYTSRNNTGTLDINVGRVNGNRYQDKDYFLTHPTTGYDVNPQTGYDYVEKYYPADNAAAVTDVFETIVANISVAAHQVPTELKGGDPIRDGYITYTDPIGKYMEVKDVKAILYAGETFTQKEKAVADGVTTYTFSGDVSSPVYGEQDVANILITVEKNAVGDETLTIKIPAAVIPLRTNEVTLNADGSVKTHNNNGAYPARVVYSVGLQDGIKKISDSGQTYIDTSLLGEEYITANTDENGAIDFYSNLYTGDYEVNGSTAGNAKVEFEPSHTNPFYYIIEDMPIYKDAAFTQQVTATEGISDDVTYYYKDTYYHGNSVEDRAIPRTGAQLNKEVTKTGEDGYLYRAAGSPRLNRMLEFEGTKVDNVTETAEDFYAPTFQHAEGSTDPYEGKIVVYLGNNGLLNLPAGGNLQISKEVNAGPGLTAPDKEFTFKLNIDGDKVSDDEYKYVVVDADGNTVFTGKLSKTNDTFKLKDGQVATVYSLPPGTTYEVTETPVEGFTAEAEGAAGTIEAGRTDVAAFTNTYNVNPVTFPTEGVLSGEKELTGREWTANDKFTFFITPYNDAPLPDGYDEAAGVVVSEPDAAGGQIASFDFGTIEFTAPGTYRYTIVEKEPENDAYLPGMAYSRALYRLVVEVEDMGDGTLKVKSYDVQKLYEDDATQLFTYNEKNEIVMNAGQEAQDKVKFINAYSAESVVRVPVALKDYTDNSGENPLVSGMFNFQLKAVGYIVDDGELVEDVSKVPMPEGAENGAYITTNEGHNVTFPGVEFKQNMIPQDAKKITFRYEMSEVVPEDAEKVNGMTYDSSKYLIDVVASIDADSHILNVNAIYPNDVRIVTFKNTYTPVPVTADIDGSKTLTGRDMKDGESFGFELTGANAATNNAVRDQIVVIPSDTANVTGGQDGVAEEFSFEDIQFKKAGTYVFNVKEIAGNAPAVTYDDAVVTVTVVVEDADKDGNLEVASMTYSNGKNFAEFNNVYTTEFEGKPVSLEGEKNLTGKSLLKGEFFFNVVEYFNGDKVSEGLVSHTEDTEADEEGIYTGAIKFLENKKYTEAGTYEYYITEQIPIPKVGGTTYDESEYKFTVVVEDVDLAGKLTVTSTKLEVADDSGWKSAEAVVFDNAYAPAPTTADVPVMKKAVATSDRDLAYTLEGGEFKFRLSGEANGMTLPETKVVSNDASGNIKFNEIKFTKAGTYVVTISEIVPSEGKIPGITYTNQEIKVTITVVDDRNGNLTATVTDVEGGNTFVNEYEATPAEVTLNIEKKLEGREWLPTDKFDFEVVVLDPATQKAVEDGIIEFPVDEGSGEIVTKTIDTEGERITGNIKVKKAGTYKFVVREKTGDIAGIHYDAVPREITIVATDNMEFGMIVAKTTIMRGETEVDNMLFTNVYKPDSVELSGHDQLVVTKTFTGRVNNEWLDTDEFKFKLEAEGEITLKAVADGDVVLPAETDLVVSNANKAHAHFGNIIFNKAGEYQFKVTELDNQILGVTYDADKDRIVKVVVTDDKSALVVTLADDSEALEFTNVYKTEGTLGPDGSIQLEIKKNFTGRENNAWLEDDKFTFGLSVTDEATKAAIDAGKVVITSDETLVIDAEGEKSVVVPNIHFYAEGEYVFVIKEIEGDIPGVNYDEIERTVVVKATDKGDGTLEVDYRVATGSSLTFNNNYVTIPDHIEGAADLVVKKNLIGRENNAWTEYDKFSFRLEAADDATQLAVDAGSIILPADANELVVTKSNKDSVSFGDITFYEAGEYQFKVTELSGDEHYIPGVTPDPDKDRIVKVIVIDNQKGALEASLAEGSEPLEFTNTYEPTDAVLDGKENLTVEKKLTGRDWFDTDKFEFELKATCDTTNIKHQTASGLVPFEGDKVTITKADNGKHAFKDIIFTEEGEYTFEIREVAGDIPHVAYDKNVIKVIVEVSDNAQGELVIATPIVEGDIVFENTYTPVPVEAVFDGIKTLNGRELANGEFEFILTADDAKYPMPSETKAKNKGNAVKFPAISFTEAGTYTYKITEEKGSLPSVTYDEGSVEVTVVVSYDKATGVLSKDVSYKKVDGNGGEGFEFVNNYAPDPAVPVDIIVDKAVSASTGNSFTMEGGDFEFEIEPSASNPQPDPIQRAIVENTAEGKVSFADDAAFVVEGVYEYTVHEVGGTHAGISYDPTAYRIKFVVEDDTAAGKLVVTSTTVTKISGDGSESVVDTGIVGIKFNNGYDPKEISAVIHGHKKLEGGHKALEEGEFQFQIEAVTEGAPLPADTIVENEVTGLFQFDAISYDKVGVYKYVVSEIGGNRYGFEYDLTEFDVTVTVTDEGGVLKAVVDGIKYDNDEPIIVIENEYAPHEVAVSIEGQKILDTPEGSPREMEEGEFHFELLDEEGKVIGEASNDADGDFIFENVKFFKAGDYTYTIREVNSGTLGVTYDKANIAVHIKVTDEGYDGQLEAVVETAKKDIVFNNEYAPTKSTSVQLGASKLLDGRILMADEFTFKLEAASEDAPMPKAGNTAKNDLFGNVKFNPIEFTKIGTYEYIISEVEGDVINVTYDKATYKAVVKVADGGKGALVVEKVEVFDKDGKAISGLAPKFMNAFTAPDIYIEKTQQVNDGEVTKVTQSVKADDIVTYYLTVKNNGAGKASNAVVTDTVPEGLDVVSIADGGTETKGVITWNIGEIAIGGEKTVSFKVKVPQVDTDTTWKNIASIVFDEPGDPENPEDPNHPDVEKPSNEVTVEENVEPLITVNKEASKTDVKAGDEVVYTITVKNEGKAKTENVVLTDEMPEGLEILVISDNGTNDSGKITWNIGELGVGAEKSVTVKVKVPVVEEDTAWENIATVTYDEPGDPEPEDPVPSEPEIIKTDVDPKLTVDKTSSAESVKVGDKVDYTITVKNIGDGKAEGIIITDVLPEGLIFVSADQDGVHEDGVVTWMVDELGADEEVVVTVTVEIPNVATDTEWNNVATVVYNEPGEDPKEDDSEDVIVVVDVDPVVELTKEQAVNDGEPTTEVQAVKEGDLITYYLTVINNGTGDATGIVITDKVPEGLELVDAGEGVEEDGTISWEIDQLAAGESQAVYFIVRVPAVDADTAYKNTAQLIYNEQSEDSEDQSEPGDPQISNTVVTEQAGPEPKKPEPKPELKPELKPEPKPELKPEPKAEEPKNDAPDTGDNTNMMLWLMLLGLSGAGLAGATVYKRRRG